MSDVFHVGNGVPANYNDGTIKLSVNGTLSNAKYPTGGKAIGALVDEIAKARGIRAFSVYADGRKLTTANANDPAASFREVDVVAKDARGAN